MMIQPSELRKGNLLNWSLKLTHPETTLPDELVEVGTVYGDKIAYTYPNLENRVEPFEDDKAEQADNTIPFSELQPILLTEEWLTKAGVEVTAGKAVVNAAIFQWNGEALHPESSVENAMPFRYLHQLQNYIANQTGKPLDINFNWE